MTKPDLTETELQRLFDAARDVPAPEPAFLRRLEDDAAAALRPVPRRRYGTWHDVLGGWRGASGLVMATLVGLWIGVAPPNGLPDPAELIELALSGEASTWDALPGLEQADWNLEGNDDV